MNSEAYQFSDLALNFYVQTLPLFFIIFLLVGVPFLDVPICEQHKEQPT